jgi:hypothetical protein
MWNKIRNWVRKNILTENEVITSESTVDISKFRDYKDNQDKRQTYLLEKLKEFEDVQKLKFRSIEDRLTSIELSLSNMMFLIKKQDEHLAEKKELRFLDDMNFKIKNRNDFKREYDTRKEVSAKIEEEKLEKEKEERIALAVAEGKEPILEEETKPTNPNVIGKIEWNKMRKGDQREYLQELSEEDKIAQLEEINPFLGGSSGRRGREWMEEQLSLLNPIGSFKGISY